jgi:hypothetical protein
VATVTTTPRPLTSPQRPVRLSSNKAARLLFGGAGLLLVFGACSDSGSPKVGSAVNDSSAPVVTAAPTVAADTGAAVTTATTTVAAVAGTVAAVDGAALLQQAVTATGGGYHFNQTATVDGTVALTVEGDRLPDGARLAVSSDAGLVFYVITPAGTWLMPQNGEWEADDSSPPAVDPITALSAPTSVTVAGNDGTTVQLVVTVPLASLGIPGGGDASLQVAVVSGALSTIAYSTTTADGKVAATNTIIGAVVDSSPVVPPI